MQRFIRYIAFLSLAITSVLAVPGAGGQLVQASAGSMTMHIRVRGDMQYTNTLSHREDATYTIPSKYSCVRFTRPNFAPKGKPLAYAVNFDNPDVLADTASVFFSFYYDPKARAGQRVDGAGESNLLVVPAANVAFGPGGVGTYSITVRLSPDLHSGSFKAVQFRNLLGGGHGTIEGSWSCPTLFIRPT